MHLPPWMIEKNCLQESSPQNEAVAVEGHLDKNNQQWLPRANHSNLARKTIRQFARILEEISNNEKIALQPGLLQQIDPRAKVIGLIGLVVCTTLLNQFNSLLIAYSLCLLLALLSKIPLHRLFHVWMVVPLFSAAIMLPAMLNIVTPGEAIFTIWHFPHLYIGPWRLPVSLSITDTGIFIALRFILRTTTCVTLALLLTITTPANRLFRGLRSMGVPVLFIMLLNMMERYVTIFLRTATEIHLAKISRSIDQLSIREEQAWVASGIGSLFRRTQTLGNAVYLAMLSRGYRGDIFLLEEQRWQLEDWAFIMIAVGTILSLLILG